MTYTPGRIATPMRTTPATENRVHTDPHSPRSNGLVPRSDGLGRWQATTHNLARSSAVGPP